MAPHIPACRAVCPHPAKRAMPRGTGIAPPSRRLQCLREGIMALRIPACRAVCPHPAKRAMPRGTGIAPPSRRLQCLREGIMAPHIPACRAGCPHPAKPAMPRGTGRSSLPKAPMPSGGYHGPTHPGLPGGMSTSREARDASRDGDRSSLPKAPMPSGGYHGPTHPGLPGGMSTSREARDAARDGDVPPTGEALSRGRSGSQALPWTLRYEPFRRKRGAIHLHFRPAPVIHCPGWAARGPSPRASAGQMP